MIKQNFDKCVDYIIIIVPFKYNSIILSRFLNQNTKTSNNLLILLEFFPVYFNMTMRLSETAVLSPPYV